MINFKSNADIFWACQVTSFGLKNNNYEIKAAINKNLIFDTGTNAIILPLETLYQLKDGFSLNLDVIYIFKVIKKHTK